MTTSAGTQLGISGSSIPETDCPSCQKPWSHTELKRTALHPELRGSPGARRTKDLRFRVCNLCDRIYSEHFDTRERYTYFRFVGEGALHLLATDATFPDICNWMAEHSSEDGWMIEVLGSAVLKRRPEDLQPGVDVVLDRLRRGVDGPSQIGAWRAAAMFRLLARAVERAAKDDLRPPGNKQVRRLETQPEDLAWALEHVRYHEVDGLARYGCSIYTVQRLAYDHLFTCGASAPDGALIAIEKLSPLWQSLDDIVLNESVDMPSRGYLLKTCWESLETLRNVGARPGNEHVLFMPEVEWRNLFGRLDRVNRLAFAVERLLRACESGSQALNAVLNDEGMNIQLLVKEGGRIAPPALERLEAKLEALGSVVDGSKIDDIVYRSLSPVVRRAQQSTACDYGPSAIAEALGLPDLR